MMDWTACPAVERSADTLSGVWRFKNTRVPVKALFENLESGATVDQFLDWFPGVNREQVLAVLAFAEESLAVTCPQCASGAIKECRFPCAIILANTRSQLRQRWAGPQFRTANCLMLLTSTFRTQKGNYNVRYASDRC